MIETSVPRNGLTQFNQKQSPPSAPITLLSPLRVSSPDTVRLPSLVRKMESRGVSLGVAEELPPPVIFSPIKKKKRATVAKSNTKEFKGLVALINHSSKSSNSAAGTVDVLKKWEELSRI